MKQVIILLGLKGSGKTYIGTLIQNEFGIKFFRVEDIWLTLKQIRFTDEYVTEGFRLVEHEIDKQLIDSDQITIESTGTTEYFQSFLNSLKSKYKLKLIKIEASPDTCLERIKSRDTSLHVPVSDDIIETINQEALRVDLEFDLVIDNESSSENEIMPKLREILS